MLQAALPSLPVSEEYAEVCAYAASELVYTDRHLSERYLIRTTTLSPDEVSVETRNWIARIQAFDYFLQADYEKAYSFALKAQKTLDDAMTQGLLADIELAWAQSLKDRDPAKSSKLLNQSYSRSKPLVLQGMIRATEPSFTPTIC